MNDPFGMPELPEATAPAADPYGEPSPPTGLVEVSADPYGEPEAPPAEPAWKRDTYGEMLAEREAEREARLEDVRQGGSITAETRPAWLLERMDVGRQWWEALKGETASGADHLRAEPFRSKAMKGEVSGTAGDFFKQGGWDASMNNRMSSAGVGLDREELKMLQREEGEIFKQTGDAMDLRGRGLGEKIVKGAAGSGWPMLESMAAAGAGSAVHPLVGKTATGAYWQQQGAGMMLRSYMRDKDVDSLDDEQLRKLNATAQAMAVPYALVEFAVSSVPGMKALGSSVDQQIANVIFRKTLANPTLMQKVAKGGTEFGIRFLVESLVEESGQGGIDDATQQIMARVEKGDMLAIKELDWKKIFETGFDQGVESMPAVLGITAAGGAASGIASKAKQSNQARQEAELQELSKADSLAREGMRPEKPDSAVIAQLQGEKPQAQVAPTPSTLNKAEVKKQINAELDESEREEKRRQREQLESDMETDPNAFDRWYDQVQGEEVKAQEARDKAKKEQEDRDSDPNRIENLRLLADHVKNVDNISERDAMQKVAKLGYDVRKRLLNDIRGIDTKPISTEQATAQNNIDEAVEPVQDTSKEKGETINALSMPERVNIEEKSKAVTDTGDNDTGWNRLDYDRNTVVLWNRDTGEIKRFENANKESGSLALRNRMEAEAYAIDNRAIERPEPKQVPYVEPKQKKKTSPTPPAEPEIDRPVVKESLTTENEAAPKRDGESISDLPRGETDTVGASPAPAAEADQITDAGKKVAEPTTYRTIKAAREATGATRNRIEGGPGKWTVREQKPRAMDSDGRVADGKGIAVGDVFRTSSGRITTPYPKYSTARTTKADQRKMNQWLIDNATEEAKSRSDDFNSTQFKGMNAGNFTASDSASANMYLFGEQPKVPKPLTKPLIDTTSKKEQSNANEREGQKDSGTEKTKDGALSESESGAKSYRGRTERQVREGVELDGLAGEMELFLDRLNDSSRNAALDNYGKKPIRDETGTIIGWFNQGRVYPEGFDGKSIVAIKKFIKGERKLTQGQLDTVERAYDLIVSESGITFEVVRAFNDDIKEGERPPQEVIDENPNEWAIALAESGKTEEDLGDTSFDFGFNEIDDSQSAEEQTQTLEEWKKKNGLQDAPEQEEMFGKGAVGDVFELRPETVKGKESFSEKQDRQEKEDQAEKDQTDMFGEEDQVSQAGKNVESMSKPELQKRADELGIIYNPTTPITELRRKVRETSSGGFIDISNSTRGNKGKEHPFIKQQRHNDRLVHKWYSDRKKAPLTNLSAASVDRQADIKKSLNNVGGDEAIRLMTLRQGASAESSRQFKDAEHKINKILPRKSRTLLKDYIAAMRVVEATNVQAKRGVDLVSPVEAEDARNWVNDEFNNLAETERDAVTEAAQVYWNVMSDSLKTLHDEGLIGDQAYQSISENHKFYSPRLFVEFIDPVSQSTKGERSHDSGVKGLGEGSGSALAQDPFFLLANVLTRTQNRVFHNRANKSLHALSNTEAGKKLIRPLKRFETVNKETGESSFQFEPSKRSEGVVKVFIDGVETRMALPARVAEEWNGLPPALSEGAAKTLQWASGTKILKALATGINPEFAISNLPRDAMYAWFVSGQYDSVLPIGLLQLGSDYARVAADAVMRKGAYVDYIKEGGGMDFLTTQGAIGKTSVDGGNKIINKVGEILAWAGETSEIATRLAVRDRAIKNGMSGEEATFAARNMLDFSQGGTYAKAADNAIPYLNAAIQGTRGGFRAFKTDPAGASFKAAQLASIGYGMAWAVAHFFPDLWDSIDDREKATKWIIPLPWKAADKNGNQRQAYIGIAKDQFQQLFAAVGQSMADGQSGRPWDGQLIDSMKSILPVDATTLPPIAAASIAYFGNYDTWTKDKVWNGYDDISASNEFDYRTPEISKDVALLAKQVGIEISPDRLTASTSKIIPRSNPLAGTFASMYQAMQGDTDNLIGETAVEQVKATPFLRRLLRFSRPINIQPYTKEQASRVNVDTEGMTDLQARRVVKEAATAKSDIRQPLNVKLDKYLADEKDRRPGSLKRWLAENVDDKEERKRLFSRAKVKYPEDISGSYSSKSSARRR